MRASQKSRKPAAIIGMLIFAGLAAAVWLRTPPSSIFVKGRSSSSGPKTQSAIALVVIDIQKDFWIPEVSGSHPDFEANIVRLLQGCRETNIPVLHIRTVYDSNLTNWPDEFQAVHDSLALCEAGTEGEEPLKCAAELATEPVFVKSNFDAFSNAAFEKKLEELGIEEIYVCGLYTDVCVLSTSLSAFNKGYRVTIISDCCGSVSAPHEFVLGRYSDFIFSNQESSDAIVEFSKHASRSGS